MFSLLSKNQFTELLNGGSIDLILDARPIEEFQAGHIPGAVHIAWEQWNETAPASARPELHQPGYWGELADPHGMLVERKLRELAITNDSHIVVYADGARSKGREGRIAWMLLYLGAKNVSILNGGWRAWQTISHELISPQNLGTANGAFIVDTDEQRRADLSQVERAVSGSLPQSILIDTRGTREFSGALYEYQPRMGRIPGAISLPYRTLLHANGEFIERSEYQELINSRIQPGCSIERSIWYCEVGVRAAMAALLHEFYLGDKVAVYDASFMEWALNPSLPVECSLVSPVSPSP